MTIARVDGAMSLPARFTLLLAFNPCPCGWLGARLIACRCDDGAARRYAARLSGPLRDRLDLWVPIEEPRHPAIDGAEPSAGVAACVARAAERQLQRQEMLNGDLPASGLELRLQLRGMVSSLLVRRREQFHLSPRRLHRAMRVARTIADLDGSEQVTSEHVDEALHYRPGAVG